MDQHRILYLSRADVEQINLPMESIISALETMFVEKGHGRTEMPPKPGIHTAPDAFIHAMPAYIPSLGAAGMKWVSGYPTNMPKGLPYITGLLILNDPDTGFPIAVMDCAWITAKRTGAATAASAMHLARKDSETVGIAACGVQGRSNLEALACRFPIRRVKAYDIRPECAKVYAEEMGAYLNISIEPVSTPEQAIRGADIVVTSGPIVRDPMRVVQAGWLAEGSFASLVDYDCYWTAPALHEADKLATDDHAQMAYYKEHGYFQASPLPYADLGELAAGLKPGRETAEERTIAINLGLALDDMATAMPIYLKAREMGIGVELPL